MLPAIARRTQPGENVPCPPPPLSSSRASGEGKLPSFRERRLRPGLTSSGTSLPDIKGAGRSLETFKAPEVPDLKRQQVQKLPRINVLPALIPHPPPPRRYVMYWEIDFFSLNPKVTEVTVVILSYSADVDLSNPAKAHLHTAHISSVVSPPAVARPRTALAALQKHQLRRSLQTCRGRPHTNTHWDVQWP